MTDEVTSPLVRVDVQNCISFFDESPFPIAVDTYQRGFVWSDEKIRQLVDDLADYQQLPDPKPPYYMGTILVHRHAKKSRSFIIDGQQRLTALCILHHLLMQDLPSKCELAYSPKSARRILAANTLLQEHSRHPNTNIFEQIVFTVICVERVDLAFTFFDTQNNRGVPLHATDLLKAYHLRAVNDETIEHKEALQTLCAKRWESIQQGSSVMSHEREFAQSLFTKFLWRARYWKGRRVVYGGHDALMEEFQQKTWRTEGSPTTIPLYLSRHNRLGTALSLNRDGYSKIHTKEISLSPNPEELPFAIRQPIHKGLCFFLYADKYAALLRQLIVESSDSLEVRNFREVYSQLLMANSLFLREIFLLASLIYVDQFGDQKLWEFALWLEHALGAIRLEKQQVRYEAAQNFFKEDSQNLLDVIASGFRPEQVIDHLRLHHTHQKTYDSESIESSKGVQGKYKQAVLAYYSRPPLGSLKGKAHWITAKFKGVNCEN